MACYNICVHPHKSAGRLRCVWDSADTGRSGLQPEGWDQVSSILPFILPGLAASWGMLFHGQ